MRRRSFLKLTGVAGILAARSRPGVRPGHEAPHPALDRLHPRLRRRAEAAGGGSLEGRSAPRCSSSSSTPTTCSRASPRPSSRRAGPTSSTCCTTGRISTRTAWSTVSDLAEWQGKEQGGFYAQSESYTKVGSRFMALPHSIVAGLDRLPEVLVRRGRRHDVPQDLRRAPRRRGEAEEEGPPVRPDARSHLRRCAGLGLSRCCGTSAATETDRSGKTAHRQQRVGRVREVHAGVLEGLLATRAAWPGTTPTTTGRSWRARSAPRSTAPRSTSRPSAARTRSRTTRASPWSATSSTPAARRPRRLVELPHGLRRTRVMKYAKNPKLAKDFLKWFHGAGPYGRVVRGRRGLLRRVDQEVGAAPRCGTRSTSR